jgi:uncharacterized membrane protein
LARAFTATGPSDALASAARRFGLRASREAVEARFDRHESPRSLKALVEIAPELGLTARAFRSDLAGLANADLPLIVHLVEPASGESGFGLLLERGPDLLVEEAPGAAPTRFATEEFERLWSGVVVTLSARDGVAQPADLGQPSLRARWRAWYEGQDPLARATLVARRLAGVALAGLCIASCVRLGTTLGSGLAGAGAALACALAAAGAVVSSNLFHQSRRSVVPAGPSRLAAAFCGRGSFADCLGVLSSRFARFAGIDWASVGVAWFATFLVLVPLGALVDRQRCVLLFAWLSIAAVLAVPGSLTLIAIQIWPLRRICPLCMTIHAIVLVSGGLAGAYLAANAAFVRPQSLLPWALAHAAAFLAVFGLLVAYLAHSLEVGVHRVRLGWIGATALGALAEMAGRPKDSVERPAACIRLGPADAALPLDALVHPVCTGCAPVVAKLRKLHAQHPAAISVTLHIPPRDAASAADRELCAALTCAGLAAGGEAGFAAFLRAKEDPWPLVKTAEQGASAVLASLLPDVQASDAMLAQARAAVVAAGRLADALERGTPTLLVAGRLWDGSVDDLDRVLTEHPALLAAIAGGPVPAERTARA